MKSLFLLALSLLPFSSGCGFFQFNDVEEVQTCCECLSENQRPLTDAGVGTFDVDPGDFALCLDGSNDCLCGESAESCFTNLTQERAPVAIIGACAASGGPCNLACSRALVYEPAGFE